MPTSSSDTNQLSLLSGSHTLAESCANEPKTDGSPDCTCGKAMSDCSIHPSTPAAWIAFMQDSLARTLALLESRQAYLREPEAVFTVKSCALLASFDRDTCSWRTLQQSFLTDSEPFSQTWPRWGMTAGGFAYEHPMSGRRITETDGFCWPTPTVTTGVQVAWDKTPRQTGGTSLAGAVKYWPTVGVRGFTNDGDLMGLAKMCDSQEEMNGMGYQASLKKKAKYWRTPSATITEPKSTVVKLTGRKPTDPQVGLADQVGGQLNPDWVSWLMNFPIGWAATHDICEPNVSAREPVNGSWWDIEPNIGRVAKGVPNRVGQLKGYGNAQVPLQAAAAWRLLGGK